jgi:hypothetical protein
MALSIKFVPNWEGVLPNHRGKNIGGQIVGAKSHNSKMRFRSKVKLSEIISLTKYKIN